MIELIVAALIWLAIHFGLSGTRLRDLLVGRIGEGPFRGLFSVVSIAAIVLLIRAFNRSPATPLWFAPEWVRWCLVLAMLPAFLLFVASVSAGNPTAAGVPAGGPPRGIIRITRHPMLWSFTIWASVHIIGTGEAAALVFFGSFLLTALAGMPSIDAKLARRDPHTWQALSAVTSMLPFGAIATRRNALVLKEIGWTRTAVSAIAWVVVLWLHPMVFGIAPVSL
jgi:uncharacterized membrane protein